MYTSHPSCARYIPRPSHVIHLITLLIFDAASSYELLIMQSSPASLLGPNILMKHPEFMFFPQCER
jgi:hypothetical protein